MKAVFRCDATADIGFGHLSRCMALAEAFRLSGVISNFAGRYDAAAKEQLTEGRFDRADLPEPLKPGATEHLPEGDFLVVDSYGANDRYLADLKSTGRAVVIFDDFRKLQTYPCDVVLNFTWDARSLGYPDGPVLLLGPEYFPARRRLVDLRPQSTERDRAGVVRNLLVAIGGSDPKLLAARLVRILSERHADISLRVIATNEADLESSLADFALGSAVLPRQPDLSEQLLWADACITGGGLIKYEAAFMGVPAAAVSQNKGQAGESVALSRAGLVFDLGLADDRTDEELGSALNVFFSDETLRCGLVSRVKSSFPTDPSAHAAGAILQVLGG